jgi:hypothetical protein
VCSDRRVRWIVSRSAVGLTGRELREALLAREQHGPGAAVATEPGLDHLRIVLFARAGAVLHDLDADRGPAVAVDDAGA